MKTICPLPFAACVAMLSLVSCNDKGANRVEGDPSRATPPPSGVGADSDAPSTPRGTGSDLHTKDAGTSAAPAPGTTGTPPAAATGTAQ